MLNKIKISGLYFTLHTYCNFDCSYCWQKNQNYHLNKFKISSQKVEEILNYFFENYFIFYPKGTEVTFTFSGGETLIFSNEIIHFIKFIKEYQNIAFINPKIIIQTNGSLLTDELIEIFKNSNVIVHISHDGTAQNISRKNSQLVLNNIKKLIENNIEFQITSIYEPETIKYLYSSFLLFSQYNIKNWSIGLNFLKEKEEYDLKLLYNELKKIFNNKNNNNMIIKNFYQIENGDFWKKSLFNNIHSISITPFGDFHSTAYTYTKEINSFGNITQGFNEDNFINYISIKTNWLNNIIFKNNVVTIDKIINNLFN